MKKGVKDVKTTFRELNKVLEYSIKMSIINTNLLMYYCYLYYFATLKNNILRTLQGSRIFNKNVYYKYQSSNVLLLFILFCHSKIFNSRHFEMFAFMFRHIYYLFIYKKIELLFINKILIILQ